jgi:hypothetical protein
MQRPRSETVGGVAGAVVEGEIERGLTEPLAPTMTRTRRQTAPKRKTWPKAHVRYRQLRQSMRNPRPLRPRSVIIVNPAKRAMLSGMSPARGAPFKSRTFITCPMWRVGLSPSFAA